MACGECIARANTTDIQLGGEQGRFVRPAAFYRLLDEGKGAASGVRKIFHSNLHPLLKAT